MTSWNVFLKVSSGCWVEGSRMKKEAGRPLQLYSQVIVLIGNRVMPVELEITE